MWWTGCLFVVVFFVVLIIKHSHADKYTIPACSSNGYIDVREDTGTTITCDGIQGPMYSIYWALSGNRIGECGTPGNFDDCRLIDPNKTDYNLTRARASRSELRVLGNFRPKAFKKITCSQWNNHTDISCNISIIYPGNITLPVFGTDASTWTVKSSYRVEKVYSSRNEYRCIWTLKNETNITIQTIMTDMERFNMSESGNIYYAGNCSFLWTLPTTEGVYTLFGKFAPGTSDVLNSFGTAKLERPEDPTIHCGAQSVIEKSDLTCQCLRSRTKPGCPAPSLSWPGFSDSSDLTLINVSRADNGVQYTCKLTWGPNATIVKTANYTLQVQIYGPSNVYIFNATELSINHPVCLVCRADDVKPSANFTWSGVTCDSLHNPFVHSASGTVNNNDSCMINKEHETAKGSVCGFTPLPYHHGTVVTCTATNTYTGTLFASATWRIELTLPEPASQSQVFLAAAVAGGVGAVIAVTIVIVTVVVIVRRKRQSKRSQDKENINRNSSHEFEEHISSVYEVVDNLVEPSQQRASTPKPMAEALRIPSENTAAGVIYDNAATDDMMDPEIDAGYSSVYKSVLRSVATKGSDRYAYNQIPRGSATRGDESAQSKADAWQVDIKESDLGNVETSQEDLYAVVYKSKMTSRRNNVASTNSTDQTNDKDPCAVVHKQADKPSRPRDTDAASTPEGHDTEQHQDTKTQKPTAAAKPAVKAKPDVKPKPSHLQSSSAGSKAPTGAGERIHTQDTRAARQCYENVEPSFAYEPKQHQEDSEQTTKDDDEYNTLNLADPHAALRLEPSPEYSHLGSL